VAECSGVAGVVEPDQCLSLAASAEVEVLVVLVAVFQVVAVVLVAAARRGVGNEDAK
jgi:hypothetical protein